MNKTNGMQRWGAAHAFCLSCPCTVTLYCYNKFKHQMLMCTSCAVQACSREGVLFPSNKCNNLYKSQFQYNADVISKLSLIFQCTSECTCQQKNSVHFFSVKFTFSSPKIQPLTFKQMYEWVCIYLYTIAVTCWLCIHSSLISNKFLCYV